MNKYGMTIMFAIEPETEEGKAVYIEKAVGKILRETLKNGIIPDWNTVELFVKEGISIFNDPDWYEDEDGKEVYEPHMPQWAMTVGVKIKGTPDERKENQE